jgi:hypothetical protein
VGGVLRAAAGERGLEHPHRLLLRVGYRGRVLVRVAVVVMVIVGAGSGVT